MDGLLGGHEIYGFCVMSTFWKGLALGGAMVCGEGYCEARMGVWAAWGLDSRSGKKSTATIQGLLGKVCGSNLFPQGKAAP